eukprot:10418229-Ditylum_brightwellii.AAC.1
MKSVQVQTTKSATELVSVLTDPTAMAVFTESKSTAENHQDESSSDESNKIEQESNADENGILTQENIKQEDTENDQAAAQNRKLMSQKTKDRK